MTSLPSQTGRAYATGVPGGLHVIRILGMELETPFADFIPVDDNRPSGVSS